MNEPEIKKLISQEVRKQLNIILSGETGTNDQESEQIQNLFPGMPGIDARPVMHPYGHVSRAPAGTIQVTAKQGDHPGNRVVLGHRDAGRPTDIDQGETIIYSVGNYRVKVSKTQILVGKGTDYEPMVVGETLRQLLIGILQQLQQETHLGNLGFQTSFPLNALQYHELEQDNLDNKKILAEDGGRY